MAREGLPIIIPIWVVIILSWSIAGFLHSKTGYGISAILTLLGAFTVYFFRDPERAIPTTAGAVVSPADGRIVEIHEEEEPVFMRTKAIRVSIFLSVFNVHINRIPQAGTVRYKEYRPGRFLVAWKEKASEDNEHTFIGIETPKGVKLVVKQIAGLIARRIVCYAEAGRSFQTGQRFGLIRFGSRTDLFVPVGTVLRVRVGDKVQGGSTIIGEIP